MLFKKIKEAFLSVIFPKACFACKKPLNYLSEIYLCNDCRDRITQRFIPPFCKICGMPLEKPIIDEETASSDKCPECLGCRYYFSKGYTALLYDGLVKECIHSYKYNSNTYLAGTLAEFMVEYFHKFICEEKIDFLMPVPLYWKKEWKRGFNQAGLLTEKLGSAVSIPVINNAVKRIKYGRPQIYLKRQERKDNIRGAFKTTKPELIKGKRILLIDDVFTTGATLNECSKVIMDAGALDVMVFTLARGKLQLFVP